jgi:hypothetical protein
MARYVKTCRIATCPLFPQSRTSGEDQAAQVPRGCVLHRRVHNDEEACATAQQEEGIMYTIVLPRRPGSRALAPGRSGCRGSGSSELTGNGLRSPGAGGPGLPSEQVGPRSAARCRRVSCSLKSAAERAGDRD